MTDQMSSQENLLAIVTFISISWSSQANHLLQIPTKAENTRILLFLIIDVLCFPNISNIQLHIILSLRKTHISILDNSPKMYNNL